MTILRAAADRNVLPSQLWMQHTFNTRIAVIEVAMQYNPTFHIRCASCLWLLRKVPIKFLKVPIDKFHFPEYNGVKVPIKFYKVP